MALKLEDIAGRIFNILEGANQGLFETFVKVKEGEARVFYENRGESELFFDVSIPKREIFFYTFPKSYLAEQACIQCVKDLIKEGFAVEGTTGFIEKPQFKPKQISLY